VHFWFTLYLIFNFSNTPSLYFLGKIYRFVAHSCLIFKYVPNSSHPTLCSFILHTVLFIAQRPVSRIRPELHFLSSALSPFSDYRFDIRHLEFCRLLVLSSRHPVDILMNILGKVFSSGRQKKIRNIESVL